MKLEHKHVYQPASIVLETIEEYKTFMELIDYVTGDIPPNEGVRKLAIELSNANFENSWLNEE